MFIIIINCLNLFPMVKLPCMYILIPLDITMLLFYDRKFTKYTSIHKSNIENIQILIRYYLRQICNHYKKLCPNNFFKCYIFRQRKSIFDCEGSRSAFGSCCNGFSPSKKNFIQYIQASFNHR